MATGRPGLVVGRRPETRAECRGAGGGPVTHGGPGSGSQHRVYTRRATNTRIVTPTISVRKRLREIWLYRELLIYLVRTDLKVKYKNSALGFLWSLANPYSIRL